MAENPNVIVIFTDDQGFGDVGCLNADAKFRTQNLDRLAAEGICFTNGHCSDTVCTPSRYGLLTGRYCWRTLKKSGVLPAETTCLITDERMTLASLLGDHGYDTAMEFIGVVSAIFMKAVIACRSLCAGRVVFKSRDEAVTIWSGWSI